MYTFPFTTLSLGIDNIKLHDEIVKSVMLTNEYKSFEKHINCSSIYAYTPYKHITPIDALELNFKITNASEEQLYDMLTDLHRLIDKFKSITLNKYYELTYKALDDRNISYLKGDLNFYCIQSRNKFLNETKDNKYEERVEYNRGLEIIMYKFVYNICTVEQVIRYIKTFVEISFNNMQIYNMIYRPSMFIFKNKYIYLYPHTYINIMGYTIVYHLMPSPSLLVQMLTENNVHSLVYDSIALNDPEIEYNTSFDMITYLSELRLKYCNDSGIFDKCIYDPYTLKIIV